MVRNVSKLEAEEDRTDGMIALLPHMKKEKRDQIFAEWNRRAPAGRRKSAAAARPGDREAMRAALAAAGIGNAVSGEGKQA